MIYCLTFGFLQVYLSLISHSPHHLSKPQSNQHPRYHSTFFTGVFYLKDQDFQTRRKGIKRDEEKRREFDEKDRSQHLVDNELEAKRMMMLRKELEKDQSIISNNKID
jgi:hypothetical protein